MGIETKMAVSVAEMARMVGLSRARFYQLQGTAFPLPVYHLSTRRPIYVQEMQEVCLEVRRRNCGIDGKPILFYARRPSIPASSKKAIAPKTTVPAELLDGLQSLGLSVNQHQVSTVLKDFFPNGIEGIDQGNVIRSVFIHLKQKGA